MIPTSTQGGPALDEAITLLRALADTLESRFQPQTSEPRPGYLILMHSDWRVGIDVENRRLRDAQGTSRVRERGRGHASLAVLASLQGNAGQALTEIDRSLLLDSEDTSAARGRCLARGISELSDGDAGAAYAALAPLVGDPVEEDLAGIAATVWLAEAAIRTGQQQAARVLIGALVRQVESDSLSAAEVELALAILDSEDAGPGPLDSVLQALGRASTDFHFARVEFALGRRLRRDRRVCEARPLLQRAADRFARIGAAAWTDIARGEGAATAPHRQSGMDRPQLTARELQVARLAADGLTNRQIGQRLFISPRTVGHHLASVFPKLGTTTRAQLARRLDEPRPSQHDAVA